MQVNSLSLGQNAALRILDAANALLKAYHSVPEFESEFAQYVTSPGDKVIVDYFTGDGGGASFSLTYFRGSVLLMH